MAHKNVEADVEGFRESSKTDRLADYAARGRTFQAMSDEQLIEAWIEAYKQMADAPAS